MNLKEMCINGFEFALTNTIMDNTISGPAEALQCASNVQANPANNPTGFVAMFVCIASLCNRHCEFTGAKHAMASRSLGFCVI